jgi:hypothetical protein
MKIDMSMALGAASGMHESRSVDSRLSTGTLATSVRGEYERARRSAVESVQRALGSGAFTMSLEEVFAVQR